MSILFLGASIILFDISRPLPHEKVLLSFPPVRSGMFKLKALGTKRKDQGIAFLTLPPFRFQEMGCIGDCSFTPARGTILSVYKVPCLSALDLTLKKEKKKEIE